MFCEELEQKSGLRLYHKSSRHQRSRVDVSKESQTKISWVKNSWIGSVSLCTFMGRNYRLVTVKDKFVVQSGCKWCRKLIHEFQKRWRIPYMVAGKNQHTVRISWSVYVSEFWMKNVSCNKRRIINSVFRKKVDFLQLFSQKLWCLFCFCDS